MVQEAWVKKAAMLGEKQESASLSLPLSPPPLSPPSLFAALGHVTHNHTVPKEGNSERVVGSAALTGGRRAFSLLLPFSSSGGLRLCVRFESDPGTLP